MKNKLYKPLSRLVGASVIYPVQYAMHKINPSIKKNSTIIVENIKIIADINRCTK
jgi:hypothetical protein